MKASIRAAAERITSVLIGAIGGACVGFGVYTLGMANILIGLIVGGVWMWRE